MEMKKPILSICLPTNGAVQWVIPALRSVYEQGVDLSLFEVVITDNGEDSNLAEALMQFNYSNLRYIKTQDKGFLNLVTCLQMGNGLFCKMLNHRMVLLPGMLQKMIDFVNSYKDNKPVLYFLNGNGILPRTTECNNIDEFVYSMNVWVSWSAGIGFWDIDKIKLSSIEPNEMFPNTSLLFEHRLNSEYIIWNEIYGEMQNTYFFTRTILFRDNPKQRIKSYFHNSKYSRINVCILWIDRILLYGGKSIFGIAQK